jgi:hypothetical protein
MHDEKNNNHKLLTKEVVLSQSGKLVAYFSKKLSRSKFNYSSYNVELYALVQALKHPHTNPFGPSANLW